MNKLITIKVKLDPDATKPSYANQGDAGLDLTCVTFQEFDEYIEYYTGVYVEIPSGFVGKIFPRSSVSKKDLMLANCVGVIDSGYRGELKCRFNLLPTKRKTGFMSALGEKIEPKIYKKGDKIAQLIIEQIPEVNIVQVEELSPSLRGTGGFGSTDKKKECLIRLETLV